MKKSIKSHAAAVDFDMGSTLKRTNKSLLGIEENSQECSTAEIQKAVSSMGASIPEVARQNILKSIGNSNEYSKESDFPVDLRPPIPLHALDRVVRQCPELTRAIHAIVVGVASRGFLLAPKKKMSDDDSKIALEKEDLEAFFRHICPNRSFSQVMKITVSNRKRFGFAAWEILRNPLGVPVGVNPIEDGKTIRFCALDSELISVEKQVPVGDRVETIEEMRRFRRYKQEVREKYGTPKKITYFKEFGDPRSLDKNTGEYWNKPDDLPDSFPHATELLMFSVVDSGGEHPEPEWVPILPDALASRAIRVCNLDVLDNSATPPLAIIIEGTDDEALGQKIKDQLVSIKGRESRSKALIIQTSATTAGSGTAKKAFNPAIRVEHMSNLMTTEGMFLKYLEWLERCIASSMRLPLLLVGNVDNSLNRATAEAALAFAEDQVFSPERQDIEDIINDVLLPEIVTFSNKGTLTKGIKHHRFRLGSYNLDQTEKFLSLLEKGKEALSVNERRKIAENISPDFDFPAIDDEKANTPLALSGITELPLPDDSSIAKSLKEQLSKSINAPVNRVFYYDPEYDDADPYVTA